MVSDASRTITPDNQRPLHRVIELPVSTYCPGITQRGLITVSHLVATNQVSVVIDKQGLRITIENRVLTQIPPQMAFILSLVQSTITARTYVIWI